MKSVYLKTKKVSVRDSVDIQTASYMRQYLQINQLEVFNMNIQFSADHIFLVGGYTDMRKSIDGLSCIISQQFKANLFSSSLFLFCGRKKDRLKILLWQGDGFILLYKRLENGRFQWPRENHELTKLTPQQYRWLMEGLAIYQPKAVKTIQPSCSI